MKIDVQLVEYNNLQNQPTDQKTIRIGYTENNQMTVLELDYKEVNGKIQCMPNQLQPYQCLPYLTSVKNNTI